MILPVHSTLIPSRFQPPCSVPADYHSHTPLCRHAAGEPEAGFSSGGSQIVMPCEGSGVPAGRLGLLKIGRGVGVFVAPGVKVREGLF